MKNNFKEIFKYIVTFFIVIALFNLLLYLASIIPSEAIKTNVIKSAHKMSEEDMFQHKGFFSFVDNNSDILVINEAYSIDPDDPVRSYMLARKNYKKGQTKIDLGDQNGSLVTYSNNKISKSGEAIPDEKYEIALEFAKFVSGDVEISQSYSRYYHGYLVIMRPLLMLFDDSGIRNFMTVVFVFILCIFDYYMNKKMGMKNTIIFTTLLIIFGYFPISQSIQSAPFFLVMMISLIYLMINIDKFNMNYLRYYLFIVGMISCFIDFLTIPILSLFFALTLTFTYNNKNQNCLGLKGKDYKEDLKNVIFLGLFWSVGYALTWVSKAVLVSILFNNGGITSFINQILFRTAGNIEDFYDRLLMDIAFGTIIIVETIIFCLILFKIVCDYKSRKLEKSVLLDNSNIVILGLIPIAWMFVTLNHTVFHFNLFSYRNIIGPFLIYYLLRYGDIGESLKNGKKKKAK